MKINKKILSLVLSLVIGISVVGCSSPSSPDDSSKKDAKTEQKKDEKKEYKFGDTIEMKDYDEGTYKLTFEGVRSTDERNEFAEMEAKKVVFVDFNYENVDCKEAVFVTEGIEYQVTDGDGNVLQTYPVSDYSRMQQETTAGTKSKGTTAFAITSDSNAVKIIVKDKVNDKVMGEINATLE
ncbi:TPA: hypothetical protein KNO03_003512 [Clostridioides difficile]|nr:hypothetical protein [Clostridioides difficile]VIB39244.1 putative lipoprotein [Clostridioides difficile]HBE9895610.1 hypothetical protein [Clostridioides difficile]HBF0027145.1 hypothetical protein [Clostridioides difficile]HBF0734435.1 hypothetical protein [Clostridioides difficile]